MRSTAIAAGRISRDLPAVKSRAMSLVDAAYKISGPMAERTAAIDKLVADNAAQHPADAKLKDKELQFQKEMKAILVNATFEAKGVMAALPERRAACRLAGLLPLP